MAGQLKLVDIVGYRFYQVSFTLALCIVPYFICWYVVAIGTACILGYVLTRAWYQLTEKGLDTHARGVFITGCDSGFGHDLASRLDELGFTVFAGCLHEKGPGARVLVSTCSRRLHVVSVDVRREDSVNAARQYVQAYLPRKGLWGVVSNAGIDGIAEIEWMSVGNFHKVVNVNMFGAIRVIKSFLPLIRRTHGRVVVVTSVMAKSSYPTQAAYNVSKHGLETVCDSLRLEMRKFRVKVSIIEPGEYDHSTCISNTQQIKRITEEVTEMLNQAPERIRAAYGKRHMLSMIPEPQDGLSGHHRNTRPVIDAMTHALSSCRPRTRYMVGNSAKFIDHHVVLAMLYKRLPTWMIDMYMVMWTKCDKFNKGVQSCRISLSPRRFECQGRGVIITGCDSGFGYAFAEHLHDLGFTVFAGCLNVTSEGARLLQSKCTKRLHLLPLNVTSDHDVTAAKDYVEQHLPNRGVWGIVNNAGRNHYGEIEFLTVDRFHGLLDVNLWGYVRVTKAFLPLIRSTKGRIVMISSVHGRMYWPRVSTYGVSKVGIETITDSLRLEMIKFGVKVILLEPGSFAHATSILDGNQNARFQTETMEMWADAPHHVKDAYSQRHVMSWLPQIKGGIRSGGDIRPIVCAMEHALTSGTPKTRYLVAGTAALIDHTIVLAMFARLLPTWMTDIYLVYKTGCGRLH